MNSVLVLTIVFVLDMLLLTLLPGDAVLITLGGLLLFEPLSCSIFPSDSLPPLLLLVSESLSSKSLLLLRCFSPLPLIVASDPFFFLGETMLFGKVILRLPPPLVFLGGKFAVEFVAIFYLFCTNLFFFYLNLHGNNLCRHCHCTTTDCKQYLLLLHSSCCIYFGARFQLSRHFLFLCLCTVRLYWKVSIALIGSGSNFLAPQNIFVV